MLQRLIVVGFLRLAGLPLLAGSWAWAADPPASPPADQAQADGEAATAVQHPGAENKGGDILNRSTLTGDWFGLRPKMEDFGVTFDGRVTQFGFGIAGGMYRPLNTPAGNLSKGDSGAYTGHGEYDLVFDLDKLVGLPKGRLLVRAEHWFGEYGNVSLRTGAFTPAVFPAVLPVTPNDPGVPYLTNFFYTQPLTRRLVVFLGKRDVLGAHDQDKFAGGDGTQQFVNQAFIANPAFLLGLPYSAYTIGMVTPQDWGKATLFVYDPKDRTDEFLDFNDVFSKGVIVGGEARVDTRFFDLPGEQHIGALWKHHAQTDLSFGEPTPGVYPEPTVPGLPTKRDAYTVFYGFDQYLFNWSKDSDQGWGVFGKASISDGNPTPMRYFLSLGIGGDSPFGRERGDTFGLGWYFNGASSAFGPVPRRLFDPRNGTGVEFFYNVQVTPWLNITPDLQYVSPGTSLGGDSFVYGLRVNTRL
ncbi:MAG: carbohydrate porin [Candidatus Methylumidiphilus sp.]